ncbi:MAG: hypothetical protein WAU15_00975 [Nitrosomonas sp.]
MLSWEHCPSGSIKKITGGYLHAFPIIAELALFKIPIAAIGLNPEETGQAR